MSPAKICLLYYKNILDECFYQFFDLYGDEFVKTDGGVYAFSGTQNKKRVFDVFKCMAVEQIRKYTEPFRIDGPKYYFIIGGCVPRENILLKYGGDTLSGRLRHVVEDRPDLKYVFAEKDIDIDMREMNRVFDDVFNSLFESRRAFTDAVGPERGNVFMIRHRKLDCYAVFKSLKYIYGRSNCVNIYEEKFEKRKPAIMSVNELVNRQIAGKHEMNRSREFIQAVDEIRRYSGECIKELCDG